MPTKHPRVAIVLPQDVKSSYERAAALMGTSLSKCIANVLIEGRGAIDGISEVLEKQDNPAKTLARLATLSREMNNDNQMDIIDSLVEKSVKK